MISPLLIARGARASGVEVVALGVRGFTPEELGDCVTRLIWIELGHASRALEILRENGVTAVTMAGRIPHSAIFHYKGFDKLALKVLGRAVTRRADSLLGAVADEFAREGIQMLDSTVFVRSLMPAAGHLTHVRKLDKRERADIEFGWPLAKAVAGQDIGQTIIVKDKAVIAVEAFEGTDECIRRAGPLAGPGSVVVKVSKPAQDKRFDIPVVGLGTIERMAESGCSALAINADESLVFERDEMLALADRSGIVVVAVGADGKAPLR